MSDSRMSNSRMSIFGELAGRLFNSGERKRELLARARTAIEQGGVLLDVRTAQEFALGCLPGALNIPVQELDRRLGEIAPGKPIVCYCQAGARSASAARILRAHGFEVIDLGPMHAWQG